MDLNISSNATRSPLNFYPNSYIIFSGRNGSAYADEGNTGGNAGVLNITVPDLMNTTYARFVGVGGLTLDNNIVGGSGGVVQLNYHGLIRNFSDMFFNFDDPAFDNRPILTRGTPVNEVEGTPANGRIVYNKDYSCDDGLELDPDVNNDGLVDGVDVVFITDRYNNQTLELAIGDKYADVTCKGKVDVEAVTRVGFEWHRGQPEE